MENEKSIESESATIFDLVIYPDDRLRMECDEVTEEEFGSELLKVMEQGMMTSMQYYNGVGLAAPQVSINRRAFCFRTMDGRMLGVYNPTMMSIGDLMIGSEEGCLSIPRIEATIERHAKVSLSWRDRDGNEHREIFEDMDAVVVQHEMDHLKGVLFIDHLSKLKRSRLIEKLRKGKANKSIIQVPK